MGISAARRQDAILDIVQRDGFTNIPALTRELGVSQATIRRDLARLDRLGRLRRTYGGALATSVGEVPYRDKLSEAADAKQRIARAAAALVTDGMAVGFTGGTTTLYVARALSRSSALTVVTNALTIAMEFSGSDTRVIVTGGELRGTTFELIGPLAEPVLQHIHLDLMFVGVDGISAVGGLTTHHPIEAQANRALMERAAKSVVVADSRKLGRRTFAQIAPIDRIAMVITDADGPAVEELNTAGVEVVVA
ncbi:MAG TPA: DeoR/GlpR family DNA-binding transcription regulator [Chloroflexota bacterium]|nr:DeoR/GlpR family DNA-binding transcription regulator [Chloroflexota bacterium]